MKQAWACCLLLFSIFSYSATASSLPTDVYAKLPEKSMLTISPSATKLAFRSVKDGQDLIAVLDIATNQYIGLANISGVNPTSLYFVTEDKVILVAEKNMRLVGYRGRHDMSSAFVYNLKTREIHQLLTTGYGIYRGQSALGRVVGISKDGKYAFMPAWRKKNEFSLLKVNLEHKRKPKIYQKGTHDTIDFFLNQNNEVIARERYNNKTNLHRIQARVDDEWVNVFQEETPFITKGFRGVTPDGKSLVVRMEHEQTGRWAYYTMSLQDGAFSKALFSHEDKDVEGLISGIDNQVHGVSLSGFKRNYQFFDEKLNRRMRGLNQAIPGASISIHDFTPEMSKMLLYVEGEQFAGDYFLYANGGLNYVVSSRPEIPQELINRVEVTEYKARDGLVIPTLITHPSKSRKGPKKSIVLPHGGPESYDRFGFDYLAQYFSAQGYLVIQPQFRGSTGFGLIHLSLGRGQWARGMQDDLTDAVTHYANQGLVDANNVCIVGLSYGGYAALAGAVYTPDLYKCVVSINGVSDVESMIKTEKRDHGRHHWVLSYWETVIANGTFDEDHLEQISPVNFAEKVKAPVLLIHGEYDEIVPLAQSENMFEALEDLEKDVTFVELEDGNHHLSKAENRMRALKAIDTFVKKHL